MHDANKRINSIAYNALNLPKKVIFANIKGTMNEYVYFTAGEKLAVVRRNADGMRLTDHVAKLVYGKGSLETILVEGGYRDVATAKYHYYIQDHLGNNRVVATATGAVVQTNHYYPYGMTFAEGIQTSRQPYKFGGKEKESWQDLGSSDFGARIYQPALAEFDSGDPMMEKYYPWTIYSYCSANPVNRIDPDGMDWIQDRYGSYLFDNNATSQETTRYGWTYIGASLPEDVSRYRILEEIDGFLYHKNTTNLFALIVNGIAGKDIMVEKKAYDPAGDYMTASAIESLGWIAAGGALNKLVSKAAPKVFPAAGSEGVTVVGEGMARVEQAASKIPGARILNDMPAFTGTAEQITSQMMQYNRRWLLDAMRSGRPIIDIGKDLHQINPSIFYQMEQNMMKNYQILHPNKLIITRP